MKNIAIIGSTGSIGTQTLEIVRENTDLNVVAISAGSNVELLEKQAREFQPDIVGIWDEDNLSKYKYLVIPDVVVGSGNMLEFSKVTDIGEGAFQGNIWIESVYIPTHIVKIQKNAFNGCTSLAKVSYAGSKEQWEKIVIESGNDCLKNLPVEYNAVAPYTSDR